MQIAPETIHGLPESSGEAQSVFDSTGGLHAAARYSLQGELESVREDVGRHNAGGQLVGAALRVRPFHGDNTVTVKSPMACVAPAPTALDHFLRALS